MSIDLLDGHLIKNKKTTSKQPKRYSAQCRDCKKICFGRTQKEADAKKKRHDCLKRK